MSDLRAAVLGAGAVGSFFGGMLARAGVPVTLIGRRAHVRGRCGARGSPSSVPRGRQKPASSWRRPTRLEDSFRRQPRTRLRQDTRQRRRYFTGSRTPSSCAGCARPLPAERASTTWGKRIRASAGIFAAARGRLRRRGFIARGGCATADGAISSSEKSPRGALGAIQAASSPGGWAEVRTGRRALVASSPISGKRSGPRCAELCVQRAVCARPLCATGELITKAPASAT